MTEVIYVELNFLKFFNTTVVRTYLFANFQLLDYSRAYLFDTRKQLYNTVWYSTVL